MEIYENFSAAPLNGPIFSSNYSGFTTAGNTGVIGAVMANSEKVLSAKAGLGTGYIGKSLLSAGQSGRVQFRIKVMNNTNPGIAGCGFCVGAPASTSGSTERGFMLNSNGDLTFFGNNTTTVIVAKGSYNANEWLTVTVCYNGAGTYTACVYSASGSLLGNWVQTIPADASSSLGMQLYFNNQANPDANGFETDSYFKEWIGRSDLFAFNTVTQQIVHTRFCTPINSESAYIIAPKNLVSGAKAIIQGHGSGGHASFSMQDGTYHADRGIVQCYSNTHNDSWGNAQSNSDIETLRQWLVTNLGINAKITMFGISMGGMTALNYANHYPQNIDKLILDSGCCNQRNPTPGDTSAVNTAFGTASLTNIAEEYSPVLNYQPLVGLPLVFFTGDADPWAPPGLNTRLLTEQIGRAGGSVMYLETPGGGHTQFHTPSMVLDLLNAPVSTKDPNAAGNLVDQTQASLTQLVILAPRSIYTISTTAANILSYCIDNVGGTYTVLSGTQATITTANRRMMMLLKITDGSSNFSNVSVTK